MFYFESHNFRYLLFQFLSWKCPGLSEVVSETPVELAVSAETPCSPLFESFFICFLL